MGNIPEHLKLQEIDMEVNEVELVRAFPHLVEDALRSYDTVIIVLFCAESWKRGGDFPNAMFGHVERSGCLRSFARRMRSLIPESRKPTRS